MGEETQYQPIEFSFHGITFGCDFDRGLIVPFDMLQRIEERNLECAKVLQLAIEIECGLGRLIDLSLKHLEQSGPGPFHLDDEEFAQATEVEQLIRLNRVVVHNGHIKLFLVKVQHGHEQREAARIAAMPRNPGYVYLLKEINGAHHKIGRAKDPNDRLKVFGVKLPYRVEYECVIKTSDMHALEAELHERFADKRVDGEWFILASEDIDYVKSLAVQS